MTISINELADQLAGEGNSSVTPANLRQGIIQNADGDYFTVRIGGGTVDVPKVRRLAGAEIGLGDTVWLAQHGPTFFILGRVDATRTIEAWQAPTFQNSWVNFGSPYQNAGYRKDPDGFVHLKGLIKSGTSGAVMFTLPSSYRPEKRMSFQVIAGSAHATVDVTAAGEVIGSAGISNAWVSLSGIYFPTDTSHWHSIGGTGEPAFENGFTNRDTATYHGAKYWKDPDGIVHLVGQVSHATAVGVAIFTLPAGYRTVSRHIMAASANSGFAQVDAWGQSTSPGRVSREGGTGWTSLDGLSWPTDTREWESFQLQNGWASYRADTEYATPAYWQSRRTGVVRSKGLIRDGTGTAGTLIAAMQEWAHPTARLGGHHIMSTIANSSLARLDVQQDGDLIAESPLSTAWASLSKMLWSASLPG